MKNFFFICFVCLTLLNLQSKAQDSAKHYIGLKSGISIPNLTAGGSVQNEINSGYSSSLGPDFAVFGECVLSKKFSLVTQLEYAAEGGKKNGFQALPNPYDTTGSSPYLYANFKSKAKLNYLVLSELAKINFRLGASPISLYIDAGPFFGYLIAAHQITSGSSIIYADKQMQYPVTPSAVSFDSKQDIKDQVNKGNFGIEGDVGFAMNVGPSKLFIEGGGNYGFLNIQKGTDNGKNHIGAATVRVGYAFGL